MKRFGYYVRLGGDAEIAQALARGDQGALQPMPAQSSEAVRRVAMWQHSPEEWKKMRLDARRRYRRNRRPQGLEKVLLVGYALICFGVAAAFEWIFGLAEGRMGR